MSAASQHAFLLRLLFDEALRTRFFNDRAGVMREVGLGATDKAAFEALDRTGLELDARARRDVLMRALCRPYPLTAAALGSLPGGPERLAGFLSPPVAAADSSTRTRMFGMHLEQVLSDETSMPVEWDELVRALLDFERGLAQAAAALRRSVEQGHAPPVVVKGQDGECLSRPPYFTATELPVPTAFIKGALNQLGPDDCWERIASRRVSAARLMSVARADPAPVTLVARAIVSPRNPPTPGVGGAPPVVVVVHPTAELNGRHADALLQLDGGQRLSSLTAERQSMFAQLAKAGILEAR